MPAGAFTSRTRTTDSRIIMADNKRPSASWSPITVFRSFWRRSEATQNNDHNDRSQYLQDLIFQHRSFDVKGVAAPSETAVDLKHVFVDVGLGPAPQKASANPVPALHQIAREKRFTIWHFLLRQPANRLQNLVILGAPGTGKTTLLKYLTLSLASPTQDAPRLRKTPIILHLRDIASLIKQNPSCGVRQALQMMQESRQVAIRLDWMATEMANGRCLIMLDGLDEVADLEQRQQVAAWAQRQIRQHSNNQFIITSRPFGYESNPLPDSLILEVKPFTLEQVRQFIENWYLAHELQSQGRDDEGVQRNATREATDLMQRLHKTPALLEMGINPLLLTMIATIHHFRGRLPDHRVALYKEICQVFLGRRQQARGLSFELTPAQKQRVLQTLAYEMMRRNLRTISRADAADIIDPTLKRIHPETDSDHFLKMIAHTSGLLVEHVIGMVSFAHLTFQEYLTAVHLKNLQLEQVLLNQVDNAWWHETIRLYAAQSNATNIIRACVMRETASIPALTLAVECLDEALEVEDDFRRIPAELVRSIEDDNPEIRRIGAEVLLQLRLRRLVRLDERTYADSTLVTQAEYQLFLDEMRANGSYRQPDHWAELQFSRGVGKTPVAGVRPSDAQAFCHWLTARDPGPWQYRLPTEEENTRPPLTNPTIEEEKGTIGYWFLSEGKFRLAHASALTSDVAQMQTRHWQIEQRLHNERLILPEFDENDPVTKRLRDIILRRAKDRAYSLLNLERRLPALTENQIEINTLFSLVQERNAEGFATDMEQALITAKAHIDNPNMAYARGPILEEIIKMGKELLTTLDNKSFSAEITQLMRQLMRDLGRARDRLITVQHSMQSEFLSHRELVRHIHNALSSAQRLLDEVSRSRSDARLRLRIHALLHSLQLLNSQAKPSDDEKPHTRRLRLELLTILVDLYLDMIILECRANNQFTAVEGIRIIRETVSI